LRGSRESTTQEDLTRAFESYAKNDYAEAARRFRAAAVRFPQSPTVHFYLGVSGLFLQHDAEAVSALETAERFAIADTPLRRQIEWYLALAYRRTNQIEQARVRLGMLCATRNEFAGRACTGLRELAGPITLSGTVTRTDGVPLSGVKVAELAVQMGPDFIVAFPTDVSTTTDANGYYRLSGVRTLVLQAYKAGFFTTGKVIAAIAQDTQINLSMDPWSFIALGDVVRGTIKPGDITCGDEAELCHRLALTVPSNGTLDVSLDSPTPGTFSGLPYGDAVRNWDLHVETPDGDAYGPPVGAPFPLHLAIPVQRGSTYQIRVLSSANQAREFELTTRLR